ncbi:MAG: transcriptional regulator, partial [Actinomycetota bacterium]|nr:transcriptional regulator [Actinomycetota bacterium]
VDLLAGLVRHAPAMFHLVLASRQELPFPTNRLVIDGLATEVDTADLAFTTVEVNALLGDESDVGAREAEELVRRTGGWAIATAFALRIAGQRRGSTTPDGLVLDNERRLFAYFADEVIGGTSDVEVDVLQVAAALPWLTMELADHLELGEAGRRLADRHRASIAMVPVADAPDAVSVAPLVREFLGRPTAPPVPDPDRFDALVCRAAAWYEARGSVTTALRCLLVRGDVGAITDLVRRRGADIISGGQATDVLEAIRLIPLAQRDMALGLLEAEALQVTGEPELARDQYLRMVPDIGLVPAAVAWRLGFLQYMRGETGEARAILERGALTGEHPAEEAALLAWTAATRWATGDRDAAEALANDALQRAISVDDARSLATAYTVKAMVAAMDGDRVANFSYYLKALDQAERARDLMQIVRIHCNCGSHHLEVGDYEQAMEELEPAIRMADLGGFGMFRGLSLTNRAEVLVAWGRLDEAVADLETARTIFRRIAPEMDTYPLTLLGQVYSARGEMAQARGAFEDAIRMADRRADIQGLVPALSGLAMNRVDDDPLGALELARRATDSDKAVAHPKALLALGWVTLATGAKDSAAELAVRVAEMARSRRDRPALAEALELAAAVEPDPSQRIRLLHEARSLWAELRSPLGRARADLAIAENTSGSEAVALAESAAMALDRIGARRASGRARSVAAAMRSGGDAELSVQVLGGFAVTHRGTAAPSSAWQSKVARDLFKMLVVNRGRPIPREVLIDRLWPGETGEKANNRLSVALSTIRSVVDPDRVYPADHVIVADRDSVAFDLATASVDVERFLADVDRGRALVRQGHRDQGLALLRLAETLYVGDLLEEQPYADWAVALREEALTSYLSIAAVLAEADSEAGDHEAAASRFLRMLERDPYNEHAHLGAVRALRSAGHHGPAQRLYRNYVAKMAEIDIEPATFPAA